MAKKTFLFVLSVVGFLFLSAYIRNAAVDVVYTDYIRHILTYVDKGCSVNPYLGYDIFTRIPITYFFRCINLVLFKYSTIFDMHLGILFLSLANAVILKYILEKNIKVIYFLFVCIVSFSLNKWEMILNGTGYVHFLCILLICISYKRIDTQKDGLFYYIFNAFIILFVAGPYALPYALSIILFNIFIIFNKQGNNVVCFRRILFDSFVVIIYSISQIFAELSDKDSHIIKISNIHLSLFDKIKNFIFMIINSFASDWAGVETFDRLNIGYVFIFVLGIFVICMYAYFVIKTFMIGKLREYGFPVLLILYSILTHIFVCLSRISFLDIKYGMSSRYSLSFQLGITGLILIIGNIYKESKIKFRVVLISFLLISGCLLTTADELAYVEARHNYFVKIKSVALNYENEEDGELKTYLQYKDGDKIREALDILKEKKLNIFAE